MKAIARAPRDGAPLALLALLALLPATPGDALAQGEDGVDLGDVAEELRRIREEIRVSEGETAWLYAASLAVGVAVAVVAFLAARANTSRLTEQVRLFRERLDLLKTDMEHRLRPAPTWRMLGKGEPITVSRAGDRPGRLTIGVINAGQGAAVDVVARHHVRIVGCGSAPRPRMRSLGTLAPGETMDIHIPMPIEDIGSIMGGGLAYVEVVFECRDIEGKEMAYRVTGYKSNVVSFLFGEMVPIMHASMTQGPAPAADGRMPKGAGLADMSQKIQSVGSHARDLAVSQEPRDIMEKDEAGRLLASCEHMIERDAQDHAAYRGRAAALRALGRHEDALEAIKRADAIHRGDARTLKEMARILRALGRQDEAIGRLNQIVGGLNDDLCVHRELARLHALRGDYESAYGQWNSIVSQDPGHRAHMAMAAVCMAMRDYDAASVALGFAIDQRPEDAYAHVQKGIAQLNQGRHGEAVDTLRRAASLDADMADAHVNLAHALHGAGREEEAADELDTAVRLEPGNQKAHIDRGVRMLEMGDLERAQESFAAARLLDPSMRVPQAGTGRGG